MPAAEPIFLPPPVGGLNTRDPESALAPNEASVLTNLYPERTGLSLRRDVGTYYDFDTNYQIKTLATLNYGTGEYLFAALNGKWYVRGSTTAIATGFSVDIWQLVHGVKGVLFLNGTDQPQQISLGTAYAMAATYYTGSGLTDNNLIAGTFYRNRLYMLESGTGNVWYMDTVDAIGSTAVGTPSAVTKFDVSSMISGNLMLIGTWSVDDSGGLDDKLVLVSSTGDLLIYEGSYPAGADWTKVAQFKIPSPASRRSIVNYGGDCWILTWDGVISVSRVLQAAEGGSPIVFISDKIGPSIKDALSTAAKRTWAELVIDTSTNSLIVNSNYVAASKTTDQYVMNLETQAWCKFEDIDACTFVSHQLTEDYRLLVLADAGGLADGTLYGMEAGVYGYSAYPAMKQAPSALGTRRAKRVSAIRPHIEGTVNTLNANGDEQRFVFHFDTDFAGENPFDNSAVPITRYLNLTATGDYVIREWMPLFAEGSDLALMMFSDPDLPADGWDHKTKYLGCDIQFQFGGQD